MKKRNFLTYISVFLILLAFLTSSYILWERHEEESSFNRLEIIINSDDLLLLANAKGKDLRETIHDFMEAGLTSVLFRESSLGDLDRSGKIQIIKSDSGIGIDVVDSSWAEQVEESLLSKKIARPIDYDGRRILEIPVKTSGAYSFEDGYSALLDASGIGFNHDLLEIYKEEGLLAVPQIRSWKNYSPESLDFLAKELDRMPEISLILSNDKEVIGFPDYMIESLDKINPNREIPIAMVEFFNQAGLNSLVTANDMNAVRLHSISDKEMLNFTERKAHDRYLLAAEERNIRALYIKPFNLDNPMVSYEDNLAYLEKLTLALKESGFILDKASIVKLEKANKIFYALIFLAMPAAIYLIFNRLNTPRFGLFSGGLAFLFLAFLGLLRANLALKIGAFLISVIFPVLAFIALVDYEDDGQKRGMALALKDTIALSLISLAGGLMLASLLSHTPYLLKTDQFAGVKLSHLLPLLIVPFLLLLWRKDGPRKLLDLLNKSIEYKIALFAGIGLIALAYYLLRTGNQGAGLVLGLEEKFRTALNQYMGVRPRTKELLIGYPSLLLVLYLGANKRTWPLLFPAVIGQISLVNTYAHLHTPIAISLQRSALGLILGLIPALLLLLAWKVMERLYEKISQKYFN